MQSVEHQACMCMCVQIRHALTNDCNGWYGTMDQTVYFLC